MSWVRAPLLLLLLLTAWAPTSATASGTASAEALVLEETPLDAGATAATSDGGAPRLETEH